MCHETTSDSHLAAIPVREGDLTLEQRVATTLDYLGRLFREMRDTEPDPGRRLEVARRLREIASDLEGTTSATLRDLLSLAGRDVPETAIATWSRKQCEQAERWAAAVHLRASDNAVRVPDEPEHVRGYPEPTYR